MPSEYKINDGETIFDVVLSTYGNLELTFKLLAENSKVDNIDVELTTLPGISFTYDEAFVLEEEQGEKLIQLPPDETEFTVIEGQNIFDLALTLYGDVEKSIQLLQDNKVKLSNLNQRTLPGILMEFNQEKDENKVFTNYLRKNSLVIATSDPTDNNGSGFSDGFVFDSFY
jgi:hypothetical protein